MATGGELVEPGQEVVALDVGHGDGDAQTVGQCPDLIGQPARVEAAGIGDDFDAGIDAPAEHLFHLGEEGPRPPSAAVLPVALPQDEHGELGQPVAGQDVDGPTFDHLPRRGQAVTVETRAVGDAERFGHGRQVPSAGPAGWPGSPVPSSDWSAESGCTITRH